MSLVLCFEGAGKIKRFRCCEWMWCDEDVALNASSIVDMLTYWM